MYPLIHNVVSWFLGTGWIWLAGAVLCVLIARFIWRRRPGAVEDPLQPGRPPSDLAEESDPGVFGSLTRSLAAQIPESEKETTDFAQLLRSAGLYSPSARANIYALRFMLLFAPLVATGVLVVLLPSYYTLRIIVAGGLLAAGLSIIPRLYVFNRQRTRTRQIRNGLADMMDMLSMCLSGGLPIGPSLDHVAKHLNGYPALAQELHILKRQTEVGSLRHALRDFSSRIALPEVRQLSGLLGRSEQLGARLSDSLLDQADHYRTTRRQLATMQANKAPVKLSFPLLFCFAPAALILLMSPALLELRDFMNPQGGQGLLQANQTLVQTLEGLDQTVPPDFAESPTETP